MLDVVEAVAGAGARARAGACFPPARGQLRRVRGRDRAAAGRHRAGALPRPVTPRSPASPRTSRCAPTASASVTCTSRTSIPSCWRAGAPSGSILGGARGRRVLPAGGAWWTSPRSPRRSARPATPASRRSSRTAFRHRRPARGRRGKRARARTGRLRTGAGGGGVMSAARLRTPRPCGSSLPASGAWACATRATRPPCRASTGRRRRRRRGDASASARSWASRRTRTSRDARGRAARRPVIVTPPGAHAPLIELAAARGVHVFCEKPLSNDGPAAARALEVAERAGIRVQLGFQMRFDRDFAALGELVAGGGLGRLYQLRASLRTPRRRRAVSRRLGRLLLGRRDPPVRPAALAAGEVEEVTAFGAALWIRCSRSAATPTTRWSCCASPGRARRGRDEPRRRLGFESGVEVLGADGACRVGGLADGSSCCGPARSTPPRDDFLERFEPAYPRELDHFADVIGGARPRVDGRDGLAAMRVCAAAVASHASGRTAAVSAVGW